jgi:hypothetical protein
LAELAAAEKEGRLYISPHRIGDILFIMPNIACAPKLIYRVKICSVTINKDSEMTYGVIGQDGLNYAGNVYGRELGKTVFSTYDEANDAREKLMNRSEKEA